MARTYSPSTASKRATWAVPAGIAMWVLLAIMATASASSASPNSENAPHAEKIPRIAAVRREERSGSSEAARLLVGTPTSTMRYFGGRLVTKPLNVYIVWYGKKWTQRQKKLVLAFIPALSVTAKSRTNTVQKWWTINRPYTDKTGAHVTNIVNLKQQISYNGTFGTKNLSYANLSSIVRAAVSRRDLPVDKDGAYLVLTDPTITVQGFCTEFCGFHTYITIARPVVTTVRNGSVNTTTRTVEKLRLPYGFVGNAAKCPSGTSTCTTFNTGKVSPNKDPGIDSLLSILAHELAEIVTSPEDNGWYFADANGNYVAENADYCQFTYGVVSSCGRGCTYNLVGLNGTKYLIQQNYDIQKSACVQVGNY